MLCNRAPEELLGTEISCGIPATACHPYTHPHPPTAAKEGLCWLVNRLPCSNDALPKRGGDPKSGSGGASSRHSMSGGITEAKPRGAGGHGCWRPWPDTPMAAPTKELTPLGKQLSVPQGLNKGSTEYISKWGGTPKLPLIVTLDDSLHPGFSCSCEPDSLSRSVHLVTAQLP